MSSANSSTEFGSEQNIWAYLVWNSSRILPVGWIQTLLASQKALLVQKTKLYAFLLSGVLVVLVLL